jgi:hypothetical protein
VVGTIPHPLTVRPASAEVEAVVQVPVSCPANPGVVEEQEIAGEKVISPVFHYRTHRIWGATASILADLTGRLTGGAASAAE